MVTGMLDISRMDFLAGVSRLTYVAVLLVSGSFAVWVLASLSRFRFCKIFARYSGGVIYPAAGYLIGSCRRRVRHALCRISRGVRMGRRYCRYR